MQPNGKLDKPEHHPMYQEVIDIHDKVMPEMSRIHSLKRKLKALDVAESERDSVLYLVQLLDDADEGMMSWMATFDEPQDTSLRLNYLKEEKQKIQKVSDDMYHAMEVSDSYLQRHVNQEK